MEQKWQNENLLVDDGASSQDVGQLGVGDAVAGGEGELGWDQAGTTSWNVDLNMGLNEKHGTIYKKVDNSLSTYKTKLH